VFVLASVGTDHHPFDRFVEWLEAWKSANPDVKVFTQYGTTNREPSAPAERYVEGHELESMFDLADAVVCHGGPSTIMEARSRGHLPIVIARNPAFGEHVDEHQMRFARFMAEKKTILAADTEEQLFAHLESVLHFGASDNGVFTDASNTHARVGTIVADLVARPCRPFLGTKRK